MKDIIKNYLTIKILLSCTGFGFVAGFMTAVAVFIFGGK